MKEPATNRPDFIPASLPTSTSCYTTTNAEYSLNGLWEFIFLGETATDVLPELPQNAWEKVLVPSAFDASVTLPGRRGLACYRCSLEIPPGCAAQLWFGALSLWSRVYVDGQLLRENACGYEPMRVSIPPSPHSLRELLVLVDNRFNFEITPMHEPYFDFYQYGGILREVKLRIRPPEGPWLEDIRVTPGENYRSGAITVDILVGGEPCGKQFDLMVIVDRHERQFLTSLRARTDSDSSFRFDLRVPSPRLWSPQAPELHQLKILLQDKDGKEQDSRLVRFGLRRIQARDGRLWLNDEPLVLKGVNRHEWHPNYGPCTPPSQMFSDIQWMKAMGCNCVRGSHYPQDQRFLDLCDELGLLVWEENLGWGQREKTFASAKFVEDHRQALLSMVRESYNHPCVFCWGFLNEAGTDSDYVRPVMEETVALLRAEDPQRLITFASMYAFTDQYFDLVDFISVNTYPGWYGCEQADKPLALIRTRLEEIVASVDERGLTDKPVVISEIGAEGLYGWRDAHGDFFTESYQARHLKAAIEAVLDIPRYSGILLWHFSDVRTYSGGRSLMRPRTFNNKGTLDEYRRPKEAFVAVKACFTDTTETEVDA
ncbi:beta-galactosidase [Ruficoccus amylovorans]|uniref:Beta-galactosidase n=1 Tax=Ruficoccus amylovorans TaxID=1804625 RepID=A0A842HEQ9_9BACT|nr:glycoside hydrolase family 2 TIM barrel-domain containing protein [Ruficoccus amylovorans]MBC2593801.1 beta-galactosidase [Ruficoccus amylovorans]